MKKSQSKKLQKEALKLYLNGVAKYRIGKQLKVTEATVRKWERDNNWKEYMEDNERKTMEKLSEDISEEKARTLKLINASEALYAEKLANREIEMNASQFAQIQRIKWDILMPKNVQQFNFMKQEIGTKYTIEVVKNAGANNKVRVVGKATSSIRDTERQGDN